MCRAGRGGFCCRDFDSGSFDCRIHEVWQLLLSCLNERRSEKEKGDDCLGECPGRPPARHSERLQCWQPSNGAEGSSAIAVSNGDSRTMKLPSQAARGLFLIVGSMMVSLCRKKGETRDEWKGMDEGRPVVIGSRD